jgi:hypothetical protein
LWVAVLLLPPLRVAALLLLPLREAALLLRLAELPGWLRDFC